MGDERTQTQPRSRLVLHGRTLPLRFAPGVTARPEFLAEFRAERGICKGEYQSQSRTV